MACLAGCSGEAPQVSGIVAISNIETVACQPRNKIIKVRNNNTEEAQRVQGVYFEFGTNEDKYYKIIEVAANGQVKQAVADMVQEIILPPGGVLAVTVQYNPREITEGENYHDTYLDVFLNGPKLGTMQIELRGRAPTALAGCSKDTLAGGRVFEVIAAKTILSHTSLGPNVETVLDVNTDVEGNLVFLMDGDEATLTPDGWPTITFPLPPGNDLDELIITTTNDSISDFSSGSLDFQGLDFSGSQVVNLTNLNLTTGTVSIDSSQAPNVVDGSITFEGSDLTGDGEMTLVVAAPLVGGILDSQEIAGGVFGLELTVKETN